MTPPDRQRRRNKIRPLSLALAALALTGITFYSGSNQPQANWRFGPEQVSCEPFDQVPMFDAANLQVTVPFKAWVYVVYYSQNQGCRAMFPSDYLASDLHNPLPKGSHRLPGTWKQKDLAWFVPNCRNEAVNFITVVARESNEVLTREVLVVRRDGPDGALLETPKNGDDDFFFSEE